MTYKKSLQSVIGVSLVLLWLAACTPTVPTSQPTQNLNPLRTEVAATVLAQVTRDLASTPSVTPIPSSTPTYLPTSTPFPTASPSPSQVVAQSTVTVTRSTGTPTATPVNLAQWVSQTIADDTTFAPGQTFTMTWRLKNTGTSTWTAGYLLRYYSGDTFTTLKEIAIGQVVPPGGEIDISIPMKAPVKPGNYRSDWVMSNQFRSNFKEPVYLKIIVAIPLTPTPTAKT